MRATTLLAALLPLASAHFSLNYPAGRGDSDETQTTPPCGGLNTPSSNRTRWPTTGGSLSLQAGHDEANTAVYLALGNNPTKDDFTIVLKDTFLQVGLGTFCWNSLEIPRSVNVTDGQNATIQVVQQGHSGGGLYNCADITFTVASVSQTCSNGTGVGAEPARTGAPAASGDANALKLSGGAVIAGVVGLSAWLL